MAIKLYDGRMSWNGRKVRLLAAELGIELERETLDFQRGDYRTPEYLAKNPNGKIPTIDDDGFVLWESHAILKYLAAKKPERGLVPADARGAALVDQWLFWWTATVETALNLILVERMIKPFMGKPGRDAGIMAEAQALLDRFLPVLDAQLSTRQHVLGDLSVVDFAMAAQLDAVSVLEISLTPYGNVRAWLGRLRAKPYWKDA
jgi:glutathione S-transferase